MAGTPFEAFMAGNFTIQRPVVQHPQQHKEILIRERQCLNCLNPGHVVNACQNLKVRRYCKQRHHQSICPTLSNSRSGASRAAHLRKTLAIRLQLILLETNNSSSSDTESYCCQWRQHKINWRAQMCGQWQPAKLRNKRIKNKVEFKACQNRNATFEHFWRKCIPKAKLWSC